MRGELEVSEQALRINPDLTLVYAIWSTTILRLGRFAEAAAALQRAAERKLEIPLFLVSRYYLAFLEGDEAGMKREIDRARGNLEAEDWMSHNQALVLARSGQMRNARIRWQHTIERAQQAGDREKAAIYQAAEAVCEAHLGNRDRAKERARAALELGKGRDVEYAAAFALAALRRPFRIANARRGPGKTIPGRHSRTIRVSSHAARAFRALR